MKILMATSEAVPFAKTGGLGDVCGSLPLELAKLGHEPTLILPAFRQIYNAGQPIERTRHTFEVPIGNKMVGGELLRSTLPGSNVSVYFVENKQYFDRPELYQQDGRDFPDNCERFVFFARGVLEAIRLLDLQPDVLHCNDWQTALLPAYLKIEYRGVPGYENIGSLLTIHNLAYQGVFWHWDMLLTGLDWKFFNWQQMEFFGNLNLLKTGIVFADRLNTVSPRYAEEIQSAPLGCALEGVLQQRHDVLSGIINGVDYSQWNPCCDKHLPVKYNAETFVEGKRDCKAALQAEMGLPQAPDVPLVAFIGRLSDQKGIDLIAAVMKDWLATRDVQFVLLGTGDPVYHELFTKLAERNPHKAALRLEFSNALAHRIEAGADIFLMPSRYEPCGLNQLYSLKYGTVPVVRSTGGLADTIVHATDATLANGTATGFSFADYSGLALSETLDRACQLYLNNKDGWRKLIRTGMQSDWSWGHSAAEYVDLYNKTIHQAAGALASQSA
jgi:starch synthase